MAAMNINSNQLKDMIENKKTFLVDFWAQWCPHCRKINPAYEQIAEQYADAIEVVKLDMDEAGYLLADETTRTNLPGVYAVGDVRKKPLRQIVTATADGAVASHFIEEYLMEGDGA